MYKAEHKMFVKSTREYLMQVEVMATRLGLLRRVARSFVQHSPRACRETAKSRRKVGDLEVRPPVYSLQYWPREGPEND